MVTLEHHHGHVVAMEEASIWTLEEHVEAQVSLACDNLAIHSAAHVYLQLIKEDLDTLREEIR